MRQLLGIVGTRATMMLCWRATPEKEGSFKYLGWFLKIFGLVLAITNIIPPSDPAVTETLGNWDPRRSRTNQFLLHTFLNSSQSDMFWWFRIFTGFFQCNIPALEYQMFSWIVTLPIVTSWWCPWLCGADFLHFIAALGDDELPNSFVINNATPQTSPAHPQKPWSARIFTNRVLNIIGTPLPKFKYWRKK